MGDQLTDRTWLSVVDACEYLGISKPTLYKYMKDERLPYYVLAGTSQRRIKKEDLDALLIRGKPSEVEEVESE